MYGVVKLLLIMVSLYEKDLSKIKAGINKRRLEFQCLF
jgi:hypothetical protein